MDWNAVHNFVQEAGLWLGIMVDGWVVAAAIVIAVRKPDTWQTALRALRLASSILFWIYVAAITIFLVWAGTQGGLRQAH